MAEPLFERVWNAIPLFFPLLMVNRDEKWDFSKNFPLSTQKWDENREDLICQ